MEFARESGGDRHAPLWNQSLRDFTPAPRSKYLAPSDGARWGFMVLSGAPFAAPTLSSHCQVSENAERFRRVA